MAVQTLARVKRTRKALLESRAEYIEAITDAYDAGESPTDIAAAAGVTEGAIRNSIKRERDRG